MKPRNNSGELLQVCLLVRESLGRIGMLNITSLRKQEDGVQPTLLQYLVFTRLPEDRMSQRSFEARSLYECDVGASSSTK